MACKRSAVRSRVAPPLFRMNGRQNHSFSTEFGVIAQLGERLHGMQEVRGSIPRSSTKFLLQEAKRPPHRGGLFVCSRIHFPHIPVLFMCKPIAPTKKPAGLAGFGCTIQMRQWLTATAPCQRQQGQQAESQRTAA